MSLSDAKAKLLKIAEAEDVERAIDLCQRGTKHEAVISKIVAEDAAESERSVEIAFTPNEGTQIFTFIESLLVKRLAALKEELGA